METPPPAYDSIFTLGSSSTTRPSVSRRDHVTSRTRCHSEPRRCQDDATSVSNTRNQLLVARQRRVRRQRSNSEPPRYCEALAHQHVPIIVRPSPGTQEQCPELLVTQEPAASDTPTTSRHVVSSIDVHMPRSRSSSSETTPGPCTAAPASRPSPSREHTRRQRSNSEPPGYSEIVDISHEAIEVQGRRSRSHMDLRADRDDDAASDSDSIRAAHSWRHKSLRRKVLEGGLAAAWIPLFPVMFAVEFLVRQPPETEEDYLTDPALSVWYRAIHRHKNNG